MGSIWICVSLLALASALHPVVLIPGDLGSQIEIKLHRKSVGHWYCSKSSDWYTLWLTIEDFVGPALNCWADNFDLVYDASGEPHDIDDVDTRAKDFGGLEGVSYVDSHHIIPYYVHLIKALHALPGAKEGVTVRGAPYDFRYAPHTKKFDEYFERLKQLVEETYEANNETVVLVAHSMGGPVTSTFLNIVTDTWKDKYLKGFVSLAGAYAGATKSIQALTTGNSEQIPGFIVNRGVLRKNGRTIQSTYWLLPDRAYWNSSEVLVETPERSYTAADYDKLFRDMAYPEGVKVYDTVRDRDYMREDPGVETLCVHGYDRPTAVKYSWSKMSDFPDERPSATNGAGDGTVPLRSLEVCEKWKSTTQIWKVRGSGGEHFSLISSDTVIKLVTDYVQTN